MNKTPLEMKYYDLDYLLNSLLTADNLPPIITYKGEQIFYCRKRRILILFHAIYRLIKAQLFYMSSMKKKIRILKTTESTFVELKKTRCLKNLRTYLYLSKIGLSDLASQVGGRFDDELFANFAIATMLYDASFDISCCRKYLKDFDNSIMNTTRIESTDPYLRIFQESVDYLQKTLGENAFQTFAHYVKIEHISQLMSIYQQIDKPVTKEDLFKITFTKGGISGLALMHLMAPQMTSLERKAIYELGGVMQIIDDISDIDEDLKAGIRTLPNQKLISYEELKKLYFGTVNNLVENCHMNPDKPNETLDMLCWFADIILEKRYKSFTTRQ